MKKIVTYILIVFVQLILGVLFLIAFFNTHEKKESLAVIDNVNISKMADSVRALFVTDDEVFAINFNKEKEEDLITSEEADKQRAEEQARKEAEEKAKAEAEEQARKKAEEEARKALEAQTAVGYVSQSVQELQNYAHSLVIDSYGWTEDDFTALVNLWNRESGWNVHCYNSSSGAYGIPQALPGSKMATEGTDYENNGETQIRWGLKYIQGRYGSPSAAWQNFLNVGWY